jgi:hypothetical protein
MSPAATTALKKASKEPKVLIWVATTAVKPAAGPLTLVCDPLSQEIKTPPTIPAIKPLIKGAFEASATPKHKGKATSATTSPDVISFGSV